MSTKLTITDNITGESASFFVDGDDELEYYWTEGSGSCDCSLGQKLAELQGKEDPNIPCGESRFNLDVD